jgi:predicted phage baseplate assembly protein
VFHTVRTPVLAGAALQVREQPSGEWVDWSEVLDFHGSGPLDRHYTLDAVSGQVCFGDGLRGAIPPRGSNIQMKRYRTGGGSRGNVAAGAVTQMKTTVPYVDSVVNVTPANGGTDAEHIENCFDRSVRGMRHGGRAVTSEDFEDLAKEASREVARAKCVPVADLSTNPAEVRPGQVSMIVVPEVRDPQPRPNLQLMRTVLEFLEARQSPLLTLVITGPEYVKVNVEGEVALSSIDAFSSVDAQIQRRLANFLHPLTGGQECRGWDFGRAPHRSDLFPVLSGIDGVDHIRSLTITFEEERPGLLQTQHFLISPGRTTIYFSVAEE